MPKLVLWTLGSLEHKLVPSEKAIKLLAEMIEDPNTEHIVWGPDLKVTVVEGDLDVIVEELGDGKKKYTVVEKVSDP